MNMNSDLAKVVAEVEQHVAREGWNQHPRLFALVATKDVAASDPHLVLDVARKYTSVEQDISDQSRDVDDLLAAITWPDEVLGAALVIERIVLPESAEHEIDSAPSPNAAASSHPLRDDVRMVAGVLRTGISVNALRFRSHDTDTDVALAPDLVPALNDALLASFN
jgi:hypothetical protein